MPNQPNPKIKSPQKHNKEYIKAFQQNMKLLVENSPLDSNKIHDYKKTELYRRTIAHVK